MGKLPVYQKESYSVWFTDTESSSDARKHQAEYEPPKTSTCQNTFLINLPN